MADAQGLVVPTRIHAEGIIIRRLLAVPVILIPTLLLTVGGRNRSVADSVPRQEIQLQQLTDTGDAYWPSWSPDGRQIAYFLAVDRKTPMDDSRYGESAFVPVCDLWIMNADGSDARRLWDGRIHRRWGRPLPPPSWSFDGRYICITDGDFTSSPIIVSTTDGSDVAGNQGFEGLKGLAVFSPGLPFIAHADVDYRNWHRTVWIRDYQTGLDHQIESSRSSQAPEGHVPKLVWSWDGTILRVPENWINEVSVGRYAYRFFRVPDGELLMLSRDPLGFRALKEGYRLPEDSVSGGWTVLSPELKQAPYPEYDAPRYGWNVVVGRKDGPGVQDPIISVKDGYVLNYSWNPFEDVLLFTIGTRPTPLQPGEVQSDIYVARF